MAKRYATSMVPAHIDFPSHPQHYRTELAPVPAGTASTVMSDYGLRDMINLELGSPYFGTYVHVFAVDEELVAEPADAAEYLRLQQHACATDGLDFDGFHRLEGRSRAPQP